MRRLVLLLAIATLPVAPADAAWAPPVSGAPVRLFDLGPNPFEAGRHRGADLAAAAGEPVRAACAGVVRFAGRVGGTGTVSVSCGGWRVSYAPLERMRVRRGQSVGAGRRLGSVGASDDRAGRSRPARRHSGRRHVGRLHLGRLHSGLHSGLHFGVRREGRRFGYVDPLGFLAGPRRAPPPLLPVATPRARAAPRQPAPRPARPAPAVAPWTVWLGLALVMTGVAGAGTLRLPVKLQPGGASCRASSTSSSSPTTPSGP